MSAIRVTKEHLGGPREPLFQPFPVSALVALQDRLGRLAAAQTTLSGWFMRPEAKYRLSECQPLPLGLCWRTSSRTATVTGVRCSYRVYSCSLRHRMVLPARWISDQRS